MYGKIDTCEICGGECESDGLEWAKFGMSDCEELVAVYRCLKCGETFSFRDSDREQPHKHDETEVDTDNPS